MLKWKKVTLVSVVILLGGMSITWLVNPPYGAAQDQSQQTALVIHSGTLRVFNNNQMITEEGGEIEIISVSDDEVNDALDSELLGETLIEVGEPGDNTDPLIEHPEIGPEKVITVIKSGTLVVYEDGRLLTEDGGRLEFLVDSTPSDPDDSYIEEITEDANSTLVEVPVDESILRIIPNAITCYVHISSRSIGSTRYSRRTDYCVNEQGNEVVKTIQITNTGSEYTPKLNREGLSACGQWFYQWVKSGPWIIGPGATLRLEPWKEIISGWEADGKVIEEWQGKEIGTCFPD